MTVYIYSMRDALTGFMQPSFELNDAVAMRNFEAAVLNSAPQNLLHSNPQDYTLFKLGEFNSNTGIITPMDPVPISSGQSIFLHSLKGDKNDV